MPHNNQWSISYKEAGPAEKYDNPKTLGTQKQEAFLKNFNKPWLTNAQVQWKISTIRGKLII